MLTNWVVWGKVFMDKERLCDLYLILTKQYFPSLLCRVLGWFAFEISKVFFYIFLIVREQSWCLCDFFAWSCFERSWLLAVKRCYDSIRKKVIYKNIRIFWWSLIYGGRQPVTIECTRKEWLYPPLAFVSSLRLFSCIFSGNRRRNNLFCSDNCNE